MYLTSSFHMCFVFSVNTCIYALGVHICMALTVFLCYMHADVHQFHRFYYAQSDLESVTCMHRRICRETRETDSDGEVSKWREPLVEGACWWGRTLLARSRRRVRGVGSKTACRVREGLLQSQQFQF